MKSEIGGPFISAATLCEQVLEEKDGVQSIIRMIDRLTVSGATQTPEIMPTLQVNQYWLFLSFKSGSIRDSRTIKVNMCTPGGEEISQASIKALFEGDERGVNLRIQLQLLLQEEGIYWFDVYVDEELVTRVPLRVIYQRMLMGRI